MNACQGEVEELKSDVRSSQCLLHQMKFGTTKHNHLLEGRFDGLFSIILQRAHELETIVETKNVYSERVQELLNPSPP